MAKYMYIVDFGVKYGQSNVGIIEVELQFQCNYSIFCSNGSGRSGTFVVLHSQLERLKTEQVVDVFQGIKTARIQRMGIVQNKVIK